MLPSPLDRLLKLAALATAAALLAGCATRFDLQAHRGGRGLSPENTLTAFARAMELGVTTLELDVGVTKDGVMVIAHDRYLNADITRDASGNFLAERGPVIATLTFAELRSYDVGRIKPGSNYAKSFATQQGTDAERVPTLASLFELASKRGANVRFNIETKLSPNAASDTLPPEAFVRVLIAEIRKAGLTARATIQSFDWRTLQVAQKEAPEIVTVYLTNQQGAGDNLQIGKPGPSPWLAGFDVDDHGGSAARTVKAAGGTVWSPNFRDVTSADQVREAQALGLKVVPWTVNEDADLSRLLDWKVDGIITDYPDRLRALMKARGMDLPVGFAAR